MMQFLLRMFIPADQYEPIAGDLQEEFASRAKTAGLSSARVWYWRQGFKAIGHMLLGQMGEAPVMTVATIVAALWILPYRRPLVAQAASATLARFRIYDFVNAYLFWFLLDSVVVGFLLPFALGWVCAAISKRRQMMVTVSLSLMTAGPYFILSYSLVWWYLGNPRLKQMGYIMSDQFLREILTPLAILMGGTLCKLVSDRSSECFSPSHNHRPGR